MNYAAVLPFQLGLDRRPVAARRPYQEPSRGRNRGTTRGGQESGNPHPSLSHGEREPPEPVVPYPLRREGVPSEPGRLFPSPSGRGQGEGSSCYAATHDRKTETASSGRLTPTKPQGGNNRLQRAEKSLCLVTSRTSPLAGLSTGFHVRCRHPITARSWTVTENIRATSVLPMHRRWGGLTG
jgi:hypothetical protein